MFNFLKGKKTEITITLDRPNGIYYPGETVGVTVEILPDKDLKLQRALVSLMGTEQYEYDSTSSSTDSDGSTTETTSSYWGTNSLYNDEERFIHEATLSGGTPQRYTFQKILPVEALPSCSGKILRVTWGIVVKIDRRLAGDLNAKTELSVRAGAPGTDVQPGEYGVSSEPGEAELAILLPELETAIGQQINGQLRILPKKNFSGGVRMELVREEHVSYDEGKYSEKTYPLNLSGNTEFTAGQQQVVPFQIPIPPDMTPSIQTPNGSISWKIKGVLNRRLRKDTTVEQTVLVYPEKK